MLQCDVFNMRAVILLIIGRCYSVLRWSSRDKQSDDWWRSCGIHSVSDGTWICTGGTI